MNYLQRLNQKVNAKYVLMSVVLMGIFMVVILPYESSLLNAYLDGISAPDTRIFYTSDTLYHIASTLNSEGREAYIISRLRFDIAWPFVYSFFFYTLITILYKPKPYLNKLLIIVFAAFIFDILENTMVSVVFYQYPDQMIIIPHLAGFMTLFKWLSILASFTLIILGTLLWLLNSAKNRNNV